MKFDGIILDIDGTIWNTTSIVAEAWNIAIEKSFPQLPRVSAKILQGQFGKTMKVIADNLFIGLSDSEKDFLMEKCCQEEQIALDNNTKDITYPGVIKTIQELSKEYKLYIVSNCQAGYIELVIKKNHLEAYISDFECYGNNKKNKDENISLIVQRNNLKNPLYVGDTQGDLEACKKASVPFLFAAYGFGQVPENECFAKIDSFEQIKNFL